MKRERARESDEESDDQGGISRSRTSTEEYGMHNPGYSFVRPPVVQTKPSTKLPRVGDGNATTDDGPLKSGPEPKKPRVPSIKSEPQEQDRYGIGPRIEPSRRSSSNISLVQHPPENNRPSITGNGLSEDEPNQPKNPPPWGKHFALSGPCPKMVNPALAIYGLGGIGLPLSQRDAGFIANFVSPVPDPDTKVSNAVVDLTMSKITEFSPYQLETTNPEWEKAVGGVVAKVAKKLKVLGGPANVGFLPCNMTLYRTGDMFKGHRESKKGKGVFGTLAICLPSKHEGGDLIVKHDDQAKILSTEPQSAFGYSYIFWYTNLITELTEVSEGNRLASSCPKFLAYALDNMYDKRKLSRVILQGDDYQRVNGPLQLCKRHGFIIYLAKLRLRVGRERSGQIRENLELQQVVQLDGTKVFDGAPLDASDMVQDDIFRDALNNGDVSGFIGSDIANIDQVYHRFYDYEKVMDDAIELQELNQPNRDLAEEERQIQFQLSIDRLREEQRKYTEERLREAALARRQRRVRRGNLFTQTIIQWGLGIFIGFGILNTGLGFSFGFSSVDRSSAYRSSRRLPYKLSTVPRNIRSIRFIIRKYHAEKMIASKKPAVVLKFPTTITEDERVDKIGLETAQHVFSFVLRVFIPHIMFTPFRPERDERKNDPIPMKADDILQLIRQCVSLKLKQHVRFVFDKLDSLSMGQSAMTFEGFFLPLMKEFDGMPPGQTPSTITQESHYMAHQLAEKLRKLHAAFFPHAQHMTPRPQHMSSRNLLEAKHDYTCKDCLKFTTFVKDHTAKSVEFSFGYESRIAHYKTYQLHQITKRDFRHTCTITPVENSVVENYSVTIRKSEAQLAMDTKKGEGSYDKTENQKTSTPNTKDSAPRSKPMTPTIKASVPETMVLTSIKEKRVTK
ncbi:hypothetical protein V501_04298 [Pseudogymnoascus sp. VKM F-4519 (FW-2642)]|nr:hypothetical protein V501_04298 [Pseudogymnoascus sp. VKM F-4519 (FW-2642)]